MTEKDTSVKVAVRIRPLNDYEAVQDSSLCIDVVPGETQIRAGAGTYYSFDHVFAPDTQQSEIYEECVSDLLDAAFEGFNATILAYGQTGSGKTFTMGSSADQIISEETLGIIPRVIQNLFERIEQREDENPNHAYKVFVQFLEIYGEDIRDLLDQTRTSKVNIRETRNGEVFVTGAREELVSSYEQMMKALEDGTRNRTTASTKMNQSSSRSHAIFTVNLEHTIYSEVVRDGAVNESMESTTGEVERKISEGNAAVSQEVRKCKFHFVDLAGSERAKRTGAQGQQLKEGIDINKGLLALGNVISALGDEQKRGKVFVPYRDSKLTRMLQDSLGGNSKTLMICCVSPAASNYNESLNALRYANRARNIKNKPVVNRDPTLVMIDELRTSLKVLAEELFEMKTRKQYVETNPQITIDLLKDFINGGAAVNNGSFKAFSDGGSSNLIPSSATSSSRAGAATCGPTVSNADMKKLKESNKKLEQEMLELKSKLTDADFETKRLMEQLKLSRQTASEISEQLYLIQSERDFFRMKWEEVSPQEASDLEKFNENDATIQDEKSNYTKRMSGYLKEIDELKQQLAAEKANKPMLLPETEASFSPHEIDTEFTSAITTLIAQTRSQLEEESKLLMSIESNSGIVQDEDETEEGKKVDDLEEERVFAKRQRMMNAEVQELGQSIQLKEQLMSQLIKSQQQYGVMKAYYEQKLSVISAEMYDKQQERDKLEAELQDIVNKKSEATLLKQRETKLREELKHKDEELSKMKKKQDELKNLTQVQHQYTKQLAKLESDITSMKKQRVDLSKTLQQEKKNHMIALSEKAKEIEKLKKELLKASSEVKKLGRSKEIAEIKAKDAIREGAALKKKTQELMKALPTIASSGELTTAANARAAIKAISRSSSKLITRRIMTEEELRTKKWIDQRIHEISAREAAADALKRQYEQQLELLQRKEALEKERSIAISRSATFDFIERPDLEDDFSPSTPVTKKNNFMLPDKENTTDNVGQQSPLLSTVEEEKLLEIIEDRLSSINGQLNARNQKINDIHKMIVDVGDIPSSDKTVDVLKKTAAGSLQASHELIRLLFDMLIHSNLSIQSRIEQVNELMEREKSWHQKVEDLQAQLASEKRAFDMELTTINRQYEEKLEALLHQVSSNTRSMDEEVEIIEDNDGEQKTPQKPVFFKFPGASSFYNNSVSSGKKETPNFLKKRSSMDNTDMQLAIVMEENKFMKSQVERESIKYSQLQSKVTELEKIKQTLMLDMEDKNTQIRFLEEDRELFKAMSEDLKAALNAMGKDGKAVVMSVKDRASSKKRAGLFSEYLNMSDDEEDDDTQSVIGEYQNLLEEINRTGVVAVNRSNEFQRSHSASASQHHHHSHHNSTNQDDIFHRLNNPNNYTGRMRNVFKDDLEMKRKRIQEIRNQEMPKKHTRSNLMHSTSKKMIEHNHDNELQHHSQELHNQMVLGLDVSTISLDDNNSPMDTPTDSTPNVFSRLTKNMTGTHKYKSKPVDEGVPRHGSPTIREGIAAGLAINTNLKVSASTGRSGTPNATSAVQRLNNNNNSSASLLYNSSMNTSPEN